MAGPQPTLSDPNFESWVKSVRSLQYTKDGIEHFVDTVIDNLHKVIMKKLPSGVTCTKCTTENIIKCEQKNNYCKFAKRACLVHDQNNTNKRYRPCPSNVCDKIYDEIIANHRYGKPAWQNTDASQWCTNRWKIAVCYMSIGYSQQTSASETDLPGLINCVINNTFFQNFVADKLSDDDNLFRQARTSRNEILHHPKQLQTDKELQAHIDTFTAVLSDTKTLSTDTNAIAALTKLQQLITMPFSTTTQHMGQILAEALQAIKEAGQEEIDNLKDEKETIIESINERIEKITGDITKRAEHSLKQIAEEQVNSVDAVKNTKYECSEQLQRQTDEHIQTLTEKTNESFAVIARKNKTLEDIAESLRNEDTDRKQYEAVKGLRQKLVSLYQTEPRFLTTPISPVIQRNNRNIKDLYVPPLMRTVDKETMKPDKDNKINYIFFKDIFRDNSKNIYLVGDAGMGKSSLCKQIVSDWCDSKSENEPSDTLLTDQKYMQDNETSDDGSSDDTSNSWSSDETSSSGSENEPSDTLLTDQKYMQDFSFVFYISLRDCNADLNLIDMIKHQLQEEICGFDDETLISLLEKEKCLIVLDGLDEWTPNTSHDSCSPVIIPTRKGVRNCSILTTTRPWKLEAIRLESSRIDTQIELLGIGKHSHKAFIRHMAEQMNAEINTDHFLSSFLKEVKKKKLNNFLLIPVILKQLVCIWNQSNELRETKTSVYSQMLNLLFEFAHSRLQGNVKSTETVSNVQLPMCFKEDKKCKEFGSLLYPLSKVAFETLLSDTPEMSLVFEISTTEVHGLTKEQLNLCLDIGILSQTKYFLNYTEEHTKISFLHKTYQEFLAALWISLETNTENKQTNIQKFKNKCNTITSMFEFDEFLKFVSGMNSKTACELSEHTREITTQSDSIRKYRQSIDPRDKSSNEVNRVQKLTISCIKEGCECSHSDCHLYLDDIILTTPYFRDKEEDIAIKDRLIKINKSNIKSLFVNDVDFQSHDNSLLEVCGLEKLLFVKVRDDNIIQRLISQSYITISTLVLSGSVFNNVGILHNIQCLTRLGLFDIQLSHIDKLGVMSYLSQTRRMKEIELQTIDCKDCGRGECSAVLDLSQHDQLECLCLLYMNVAIDTVVNVTNMVKCELGYITPVMSVVNVTKSLHNAPKLTKLILWGTKTPEEAAAIVECISHQKHIERLQLLNIGFWSSELVLSPDYRNLENVKLNSGTMTKRSFRGVIDSILGCNQAVHVEVRRLYIKPVEDIEDILDNVRHSDRCQVMEDEHKEVYIGRFDFKTIPRQQHKNTVMLKKLIMNQ